MNNGLSAATNIAPIINSVYSTKPLKQKKLLWSYLEVDCYLPKTFSGGQAMIEIDLAIMQYTQPSSVTPTQ